MYHWWPHSLVSPQRTFLTWVYAIVAKGRAGKLAQEELRMPSAQACEATCDKFQASTIAPWATLNRMSSTLLLAAQAVPVRCSPTGSVGRGEEGASIGRAAEPSARAAQGVWP